MKLKECHIGHIVSALIIVLVIFILTQIFPYEFTLQYLDEENGSSIQKYLLQQRNLIKEKG